MKLLLAVSGGIDSVVLTDCFARENFEKLEIEKPAENYKIEIAHFHHGTDHADEAADFVEKLAKKYDLPLHLGHAEKKLNSEADFRQARWQFLAETAEKIEAEKIVTAHHADDQAETVLFFLARGTGITGLSGMKKTTSLSSRGAPTSQGDAAISSANFQIWRPLLDLPKSTLEKYAAENQLEHLTDPSNSDTKFSRNLIRHEILPKLQQLNPQAAAAICSAADQLREIAGFLQAEAKKFLAENEVEKSLKLEKFNSLHPALAREVLKQIHFFETSHTRCLEAVHFEEILELAVNPAGGKQKKFGELTFFLDKKGEKRVLSWKRN